MNDDQAFERATRAFLDEESDRTSSATIDAVLLAVRTTPQERDLWIPWRTALMSNPMRFVAAIAVVAVVGVALLIGLNLGTGASNVGGPGGTSPTPVATPSASGPKQAPTLPPSGVLTPSSYRTDFPDGLSITFTVQNGWSTIDGFVEQNEGNPPNGIAFTTWADISQVFSDPCHWQTTSTSVGPTVDDLVTAFAAQQRGSTVTPVAVTVDGYSGKQIDLVVPANVTIAAIAACDGGLYKTWTDTSGDDRYNQGPGQHDLLDILDVNGRAVVLDRVFYAANSAAELATLQAIVDSVKVTPPVPSPSAAAGITALTLYTSSRYGFSIGHPANWTERPATSTWALPAGNGSAGAGGPDDPMGTSTEGFIAPGSAILASAWSVAVAPGTSATAWIQAYCPKVTTPCAGIPEQSVPVTMDGHAGSLVRFGDDDEAFFLVNNRMYIVAEWLTDNDPALLPYGGGTQLIENELATMHLLPGGPAASASPGAS